MISKYLAIALLTTALMTGAVTAQTTTTTRTDSNNAATMHHEGQWRASKLVGVDVYNEGNEKIGDINEVIGISRVRSLTSLSASAVFSAWASITSRLISTN
jgi:hypothetical protein